MAQTMSRMQVSRIVVSAVYSALDFT
jgi:hypothetical protein